MKKVFICSPFAPVLPTHSSEEVKGTKVTKGTKGTEAGSKVEAGSKAEVGSKVEGSKAEDSKAVDRERLDEIKENISIAQLACTYALTEHAIPMAPQLYFTQFLEDDDPDQREVGMNLGLLWLKRCDELWVIGRRVSKGMKKEIEKAKEWGIPIRHYVFERTPQERLLDALRHPDIDFREMRF